MRYHIKAGKSAKLDQNAILQKSPIIIQMFKRTYYYYNYYLPVI